LSFNPKNASILASAGGEGSIYIADIDQEIGKENRSFMKNSRESEFFAGKFTHLKYNEEGKLLITVEKEEQEFDPKNIDPVSLKSTVRLLKFLQ